MWTEIHAHGNCSVTSRGKGLIPKEPHPVLRATRSEFALSVTVPLPLPLLAWSCPLPDALAFATTTCTRTTPVRLDPAQNVFVGLATENAVCTSHANAVEPLEPVPAIAIIT